jgi:hypothetical protein
MAFVPKTENDFYFKSLQWLDKELLEAYEKQNEKVKENLYLKLKYNMPYFSDTFSLVWQKMEEENKPKEDPFPKPPFIRDTDDDENPSPFPPRDILENLASKPQEVVKMIEKLKKLREEAEEIYEQNKHQRGTPEGDYVFHEFMRKNMTDIHERRENRQLIDSDDDCFKIMKQLDDFLRDHFPQPLDKREGGEGGGGGDRKKEGGGKPPRDH